MATPPAVLDGTPDGDQPYDTDWDNTEAAPAVRQLPPGTYRAIATAIEFAKAKTGTEGVYVNFQVVGGQFDGVGAPAYPIWVRNFPSTVPEKTVEKMMGMAKRDLIELGFKSFKAIDGPLEVTTKQFEIIITRDADSPLGKVYAFDDPNKPRPAKK
jgi:hypothetical protein